MSTKLKLFFQALPCLPFASLRFASPSLRKANQEKIEAEERAENERIEQYARDKREREDGSAEW